MRQPMTRADLEANGITPDRLKTLLRRKELQRVCVGVYLDGGCPPTPVEKALSILVVTGGVACHSLAAMLHGFDGVWLSKPFVSLPATSRSDRPGVHKRALPSERITTVQGNRCTNGLQTMLDLASVVDDLVWEQALESALRKQLTTVAEIENALPEMSRARSNGVHRIRRILALRPPGAPPTESVLETYAVQLIRTDPSLPTPTRQVEVRNEWDEFVARVDLAFPEHGVFLELDGGHHKSQPKYDASRQTAVTATMKWLVGRFQWDDIVHQQRQTLRRLRSLLLK